MAFPSETPPAYVAGSVIVPPNVVSGLLELIQAQLDKNCPGGPRELRLSVSAGGVYVGSASPIKGPLTDTNFAYALPVDSVRTYSSSYPGSNVPLGDLQVLTTGSSSTLNVEVLS